jgi:hypothetical protein
MAETERVWLVERTYGSDEDLVILEYATTDGAYHVRQQFSHRMLYERDITAARDVDSDRLEAVTDPETRDRYAEEASRMADQFDPDESV